MFHFMIYKQEILMVIKKNNVMLAKPEVNTLFREVFLASTGLKLNQTFLLCELEKQQCSTKKQNKFKMKKKKKKGCPCILSPPQNTVGGCYIIYKKVPVVLM